MDDTAACIFWRKAIKVGVIMYALAAIISVVALGFAIFDFDFAYRQQVVVAGVTRFNWELHIFTWLLLVIGAFLNLYGRRRVKQEQEKKAMEIAGWQSARQLDLFKAALKSLH